MLQRQNFVFAMVSCGARGSAKAGPVAGVTATRWSAVRAARAQAAGRAAGLPARGTVPLRCRCRCCCPPVAAHRQAHAGLRTSTAASESAGKALPHPKGGPQGTHGRRGHGTRAQAAGSQTWAQRSATACVLARPASPWQKAVKREKQHRAHRHLADELAWGRNSDPGRHAQIEHKAWPTSHQPRNLLHVPQP